MTCRVCQRDGTVQVLDLGAQPLANDFHPPPRDTWDRYPLTLVACPDCGCVQLAKGVDPAVLFGGDYPYHSSVNGPYVEQCWELVDRLVAELALGPDDLVAEVGSNDGYLLARYVHHGVPVVGWEPAGNLAAIATAAGVETVPAFFDPATAGRHLAGRARLIHANNVLAHAPDISGILVGVAAGLAPDGRLVVETPSVEPVVDLCLHDTIYHEHLFYWSATAFDRACRRAGLALVHVEHLDSHGGSLRLWVGHQGAHVAPSVPAQLTHERQRGLAGLGFYGQLQDRVDARISNLRDGLIALGEQGHRIAGYGAAAKGTMLLNTLGLPPGLIGYVVDATPDKIGKLMPGVGVPIVPPHVLDTDQPDAVLLLAWNWGPAIIGQHPGYLGAWYTPVPTLERLTA